LEDAIHRERFIANPPALLAAIVENSAGEGWGDSEKIWCVTDGREFDNAADAAKAYGMTRRHLNKLIQTNKPTASGFVFERLEK
jgi:hypothetical protein